MERDSEYINITQAAKLLGVSRGTVYRLIAEKKLRALDTTGVYARGGPQRVLRADVLARLPRPKA